MNSLSTWQKGWALLDRREKRTARFVLVVIVISALSTVAMIGSVMPFLVVLAEPSRIDATPALAWAYRVFGFTSPYAFLIALGLASFAVIAFGSAIQIARLWVVARYATLRAHTLSRRLLATYLAQPYEFFLDRHTGDMGPRILSEASQVVAQFLRPAAEMAAAILTTTAILGLLLWVNPMITILSFLFLGCIYAAIYIAVRRKLARLGRTRVAANREQFRYVNEALTGIKDIRLLNREGSYLEQFVRPSRLVADTDVRLAVISHVPQFALQAVALGGMILLCVILIGTVDPEEGAGLGDILPVLGVFAFAGQRLLPELTKLYLSLTQIRAAGASVDAIHEDLVSKQTHELPHRTADHSDVKFTRTLCLEAVSYSYPGSTTSGLRDVSLSLRAGEKIGIVGSTGAGKTTLADIVLGLLQPISGRVTVDDVDITPANVRSWMRNVGYVPQDIFLIDASVAENIALGVAPEDIDQDRVKHAARIACIDHFVVEDLPQGYETHIGERGVRLSGGQRQRIGIARAMYHNADLIVFDEATSALDNLTEAEVMEAIDALPGNKTVIMIAHRLSTVRNCDRIVVLDNGQIVGCDDWNSLISNNAHFQRIKGGQQDEIRRVSARY
jgi:ATP-binding cassette, subfamily B, bacterial PglK